MVRLRPTSRSKGVSDHPKWALSWAEVELGRESPSPVCLAIRSGDGGERRPGSGVVLVELHEMDLSVGVDPRDPDD